MSFWAEAIKEAALRDASVALNKHLNECYGLGKTATMKERHKALKTAFLLRLFEPYAFSDQKTVEL